MSQPSNSFDVYLEIGQKRVFAGAVDWPGWCRAGRNEESALQALLDAGPRYGRILQDTGLKFHPPADVTAFNIVERLEGSATTDFGAPDKAPAADAGPLNENDLQRFQTILTACWQALDEAAHAATGKDLRKGPRGGGRELEAIIRHVLEAERSYLSALGGKYKKNRGDSLNQELAGLRQAVLETLAAAQRGDLPTEGPRGGSRWQPRYFIRRAAWHVVDHIWEIEDRST
jgi:hypothetical protein